ncbi:Galactokinase [Sporomusa rhizae]|uniref:galactokinase n=1 Tax=Sporomusa rhizae TaxID=357999 RepID=UPI003529D52A
MLDVHAVRTAFEQVYGANGQPVQYYFSPGRINLIGEHIDYNGGQVFPAAISLGIYGAIRRRQDTSIVLTSTNAVPAVKLDITKLLENCPEDGWANYPKGVIKHMLEAGYALGGYDILFAGNLPDGTGLSSSAALLVLTAYMLRSMEPISIINRSELASFCKNVENRFIGVNCGIMDQFAVAMGRQDYAILLDCQTLQYNYIPFVLKEHSMVIMNTNKKRELAESKYNERHSECEQALAILKRHRDLENLCQATLPEVETYLPDGILRQRARHVVSENNRVQMAVSLLDKGEIEGFGKLMLESHLSLKCDYEVTGFELDVIVENALQAPGCIGARMTGAGFGGCAIALVETEFLPGFMTIVGARYNSEVGRNAEFYVVGIADGVKRLEG